MSEGGLNRVLHREGVPRTSSGIRAYPPQGASEEAIVCKKRPKSGIFCDKNSPEDSIG